MNLINAKIIGTVYTKPVEYTLAGVNRIIPPASYSVIEIIPAPNNKVSYVTNHWYKEYKQVPLFIHEDIVEKYEPITLTD